MDVPKDIGAVKKVIAVAQLSLDFPQIKDKNPLWMVTLAFDIKL